MVLRFSDIGVDGVGSFVCAAHNTGSCFLFGRLVVIAFSLVFAFAFVPVLVGEKFVSSL